MRKLSKPAKLAVVAAGASIIAVAGGTGVLAATNNAAGGTNPESSLIDKLVTKFGLNKADVQAVFEQEHSEHEAQHQQQLEGRLAQAVTDGTLTEDQKSKILAKQQQMQTFVDGLKGKTMQERRAATTSKRDELRQWATDNSIPQEYVRFALGMAGPHGARGPGGHDSMMRGAPDDAADPGSSSGSSS